MFFGLLGHGPVGHACKLTYALAYDFQLDICMKWDHEVSIPLTMGVSSDGQKEKGILESLSPAKRAEIPPVDMLNAGHWRNGFSDGLFHS